MAGLVDARERGVLDHCTGGTALSQPTGQLKVALYTDATTLADDGTGGTEVTGGSYARQNVSFDAAQTSGGNTTAINSGALTFTNMPACTVKYAAVLDSAGTPLMWFFGQLVDGSNNPTTKTLQAGDTFQINAGSLTLSLD